MVQVTEPRAPVSSFTGTLNLQDFKRELARREFTEFLDHVYILEPPPGGGVIKFELWPHIVTFIECLAKHRRIVVPKPKQIGISWTVAAYALWVAMYQTGARVLLFSMGETYSKELLAKVRFIYDHLPVWLRESLKGDGNSQELIFPRTAGHILALPSTRDAGVGFTATLVIMDEGDFFENLAENYDNAASPTVAAGGQLVMVSTVNPETMESQFKAFVRGAGEGKEGANGFIRLFFPWNVRPGRDAAWYERERAGAADAMRFEKNYPRTLEEALAPAQAIAAFEFASLAVMKTWCRPPLERHGEAKIWQRYSVGKRYCAASDVGHGVGGDFSYTAVGLVEHGEMMVVASLMSQTMPTDVFALESMKLLELYQKPLWAPEDNDWGHDLVQVALRLEYPRLYNRDRTGKTDRWGWHTGMGSQETGEQSRWAMWGGLRAAVRDLLITIPDAEALGQFYSVILNPKKSGRPEAMAGSHDDCPMTIGIMWAIQEGARAMMRPDGPRRITVIPRAS